MKVAHDVLEVLDRAVIEGSRLTLSGPRLDPKLYARVDEVLRAIGGVWTSGAGAHLFAGGAEPALAELRRTGECVTGREEIQTSQFFPTPTAVVNELVRLAGVRPGMRVLEPSAGRGAIAEALFEAGCAVDCVERDPGHAQALFSKQVAQALAVCDFLKVGPRPVYDRVVMNPPFTRGADIAHVTHALGFLKEDGLLVSVVSRAVAYQAGAAEFRALVAERGGQAVALPAKSFQASGTGVNTFVVVIPAARPTNAPSLQWPENRSVAESPSGDDPQDPVTIAREIVADLRTALGHFEAVAQSLGGGVAPAPGP